MSLERPVDLHFGLTRPSSPASGPGSSSRAQGQPEDVELRAAAVKAVQGHPSTTFAAPCESLADAVLDAIGLRELVAELVHLRALQRAGGEEWAVFYSDGGVHYLVSNPAQALQLAAIARDRGDSGAYAAERSGWRRMEADHG